MIKKMDEQIIFAGFGGQGVLSMGKMLAEAGMNEGREVTCLPSYGAEMRGGTSNCSVIISDEWIGAPVISKATAVIALNEPSLDKFEEYVQPGGMIFINSSIIEKKAKRNDIQAYYVAANEIAEQLGNAKVANMVMLGAYLSKMPVVKTETILKQLSDAFGERKAHLVEVNQQAIDLGGKKVM